VTFLAKPEVHIAGNRFNDGRCDPRGRFWAGTMAIDAAAGAGSLYRLDPDGSVHRILEGTTISNGLAWSADGATLYYVDTGGQAIQAFDFDLETGAVSGRRDVVDVPRTLGRPDGMAIESGALLDRVTVPVSRPTSCAFGGPKLEDLYITSARSGLDAETLEEQPLAGGLFRARVGVGGVPEFEFGLPVSG
jgi:sugar lactone lactonase YvrE